MAAEGRYGSGRADAAPSLRGNIPALTGARGPAALAVMAYHTAMDPSVAQPQAWLGLDTVFARGSLGVDFFFLLSGFIIHHAHRTSFAEGLSAGSWLRFVWYRFARIWPLHLVTLLGALGLYVIAVQVFRRVPAEPGAYEPLAVVHNLLMTQTWFGYGSPNVPAWSISAEWGAYLAFPALCFTLLRMPAAAWLVLCGVALLPYALLDITLNPMLRIACGFFLGMCLREAEELWQPSRHLGRWAGMLLLAAALAGCWILPEGATLPFVIAFAAIIIALSGGADRLGHIAAHPVPVLLGEISFAIYMCHAVVWSAVKNLARITLPASAIGSPPLALAGMVLSVGVAYLLYRGIEIPARNALRGKMRTALPDLLPRTPALRP
ncbi:acyltransferase [Roseomonas sp. E05]|nr:acyltransferase [Roseomonas sp. E05]MDJ0388888.1 acyltransferase [Roseomonas sp. E05]